MSRGGLVQQNWIGMGRRNSSFDRPTRPPVSVKLKHLGHLGLKIPAFYRGCGLTWDQLGTMRIPWGSSAAIIYTEPLSGWTFRWEIGNWDFIVTDDEGNTTRSKVKTISDLGMSWDVFESCGFTLHMTAKFENTAFLVAWRYKNGQLPIDPDNPDDPDNPTEYPPYARESAYMNKRPLWSFVDKYLSDIMHTTIARLINIDRIEALKDYAIIEIDLTGTVRSILVSRISDLAATGDFPQNFDLMQLNNISAKELINRQAETLAIRNLLMIKVFASISDMSKPVFEPWMLWKIWQWFGKGSIVVSRDRVFDLSPWWG